MAKTKTKTKTKTHKHKSKFCKNCGQGVEGAVAAVSANPKKKFCCNCGFLLRANGTCPNTDPPCDFGGAVPNCS
jgi:hypothetical protein